MYYEGKQGYTFYGHLFIYNEVNDSSSKWWVSRYSASTSPLLLRTGIQASLLPRNYVLW